MSSRAVFLALAGVLAGVGACTSEMPADGFSPTVFVGDPTRELGVMEAPGLVLGVISDMEVLDDGTILVADRSAKAIHHVTPDGELVATFGGPGEGPGEFQSPNDVALLSSSEYVVLDTDRFRLTRVQIEQSTHRLVDEIPIPTQALRMCGGGDWLVLNAVQGDFALVRVDLAGSSLGRLYDVTDVGAPDLPPQLREDLQDRARVGAMACSESGAVVFAAEWMPDVHLFGPEGQTRASFELDSYVPLQYEVGDDGSSRVELPEAGWVHRTRTVHRLEEDGLILAQMLRFGPGGDGRDGSPTELRLLRVGDGAQVSISDTLPMIATIRDGMAWGWRNLPFPQLVQWPMEIRVR